MIFYATFLVWKIFNIVQNMQTDLKSGRLNWKKLEKKQGTWSFKHELRIETFYMHRAFRNPSFFIIKVRNYKISCG